MARTTSGLVCAAVALAVLCGACGAIDTRSGFDEGSLLLDQDRAQALQYHLPVYAYIGTEGRVNRPVEEAHAALMALNDALSVEPLHSYLDQALSEIGKPPAGVAEAAAAAARAFAEADSLIGFRGSKGENSLAKAMLVAARSSARMRDLRGALICNNFVFQCQYHSTRRLVQQLTNLSRYSRMMLPSRSAAGKRDSNLKSGLDWAIWREGRSPVSEPVEKRDGFKYIKGYTAELGLGASFGLQAPTSKDINPMLRNSQSYSSRYAESARKLDDELGTNFRQGLAKPSSDDKKTFRLVGSVDYLQKVGTGFYFYMEDAFLSTTLSDLSRKSTLEWTNDVADCADKCSYVLVFEGPRSGRYIGSESTRPTELEVLYRPGAAFISTGETKQMGGKTFVHFTEVDSVYGLYDTPSASLGWIPPAAPNPQDLGGIPVVSISNEDLDQPPLPGTVTGSLAGDDPEFR